MHDIFKEQLVKRKRGSKERFKVIGIVIGALVAMALLSITPVISDFVIFTTAGILFLAFIFMQKLNVEYEYALTNKFLDIDKITNKSKRKRVVSMEVTEFEMMVPVSGEEYARELDSCSQTIDCGSGEINEKTYAGIFVKDGKRTKLIFEPDETILAGIRTFIPKKVK